LRCLTRTIDLLVCGVRGGSKGRKGWERKTDGALLRLERDGAFTCKLLPPQYSFITTYPNTQSVRDVSVASYSYSYSFSFAYSPTPSPTPNPTVSSIDCLRNGYGTHDKRLSFWRHVCFFEHVHFFEQFIGFWQNVAFDGFPYITFPHTTNEYFGSDKVR